MKTGDDKTRSSLQKDINRMKKRCTALQETIRVRKFYNTQAKHFIKAMLEAGKITKEDLKPYFKRKNDIK
jgi:hypothetical protein